MEANPLRAAVAVGRTPVQTMLGSGSAQVARAVAQIGFDSLLLDMEHGPLTTESLYAVAPVAGACPLVRVASPELGAMRKAVDAGVHGIVCPGVETPEQVAAVVEACSSRFRDVLAVVQIETVRGYDHVEEILGVPGLDAVFPGPSDLSVAFGGPPGVDYAWEEHAERLRRIADVARETGLLVGFPVNDGAQAMTVLGWGASWVCIGYELMWMMAGGRAALAEARDALQTTAVAGR
jgi:4-hydroxy-2-oxoheptanedioate aldolase